MRFDLIDRVVEVTDDRIVAVKSVSMAEEYLADHFPTFPVLPGVLMIETMVQAARRLAGRRTDVRLVLGGVRALKFASMVRPGESLRVEVMLETAGTQHVYSFKGKGSVERGNGAQTCETAVSGKFVLRPVRLRER